MKILVLGGGAREHALAWKIQQSRDAKEVHLAPGNALAALDFPCHPVNANEPSDVLKLAKKLKVDLVVVGPEAPLLAGVSDLLRDHHFAVVGPSQQAALLEGSKAHAKRVMKEADVNTAPFVVCTTLADVTKALQGNPRLLVVKADGLMGGKGVVVCEHPSEAEAAAKQVFEAGQSRIVLERKLVGPELSLLAMCDGDTYRLLPLARDYKRALDGDQGKNTGGMGSYAPISFHALGQLAENTIAPILKWHQQHGTPYRGFLFAGLMFEGDEVFTLEYNVRLGDPETQSVLTVLDGDLLPSLFAMALGSLNDVDPLQTAGHACCVVLAAEGYPEAPATGAPIVGLGAAKAHPHVRLFGAGVTNQAGRLVSSSGRILSVVGHGNDSASARQRAYAAMSEINAEQTFYRRDIAIA